MSLELIRSGGVEIKTHPLVVSGEDMFLRVYSPGQEEPAYFGQGRALAEIDYSLHEIKQFRPEAAAAVEGFRRYLASMEERQVDFLLGANPTYLRASAPRAAYVIPELSSRAPIDWCGVLLAPTDVLHAAHYVLTNTPLDFNDARPHFVRTLAEAIE